MGLTFSNLRMKPTMKTMPNNTGKVNNRYAKSIGGTAVTLNFRTQEATALRAFVQSFRLRGDKIPSLSLIARRAMSVYLAHAQYSPETKASEVAALEKLATPFGHRAPTVRKCATGLIPRTSKCSFAVPPCNTES